MESPRARKSPGKVRRGLDAERYPRAKAFFAAQPPGYRKLVTLWVMSGKKEESVG
jgi:hypothetical protein